MEVDRHLELALDAVVLCACGLLGDHSLHVTHANVCRGVLPSAR